MSIVKRSIAEAIGTFWLTFGGCGSAVFAAYYFGGEPGVQLGIGFVGVSLAFGLTVLTMAYAIGHVSGCHLNPAVSLGLLVARRFGPADFVPYVVSQVVGASAAAALLAFLLTQQAVVKTPEVKNADGTGQPAVYEQRPMDRVTAGPGALATNGFGAPPTVKKEADEVRGGYSPGKFGMVACLIGEVVLTFMFLFIILGATDKRAPAGFAPLAIGLGLTLIHLIGIPLTNLSVNPARSIGPALVVRGDALAQVWLFVVGPLVGAALAGIVYPLVAGGGDEEKK